jgi:hypothetical protein
MGWLFMLMASHTLTYLLVVDGGTVAGRSSALDDIFWCRVFAGGERGGVCATGRILVGQNLGQNPGA